ncbi:hypothetical protein SEVIR_2G388201v4 [Setaria viridis]
MVWYARIPGKPRAQPENFREIEKAVPAWWSGPTHPPLISLQEQGRGALPSCRGLGVAKALASRSLIKATLPKREKRARKISSLPPPARPVARPFKPPAPIPPPHPQATTLPPSPPLIERAPFHQPAAVSPAQFDAFLLCSGGGGTRFRRSRLLRRFLCPNSGLRRR